MAAERRPDALMRRVVVKARIVRLKVGSRAADAHIRYLQRDGTTRDGERGRLYGAETGAADGRAFTESSGSSSLQRTATGSRTCAHSPAT
jgi:type IV secretory pathway VirD2 relaxase